MSVADLLRLKSVSDTPHDALDPAKLLATYDEQLRAWLPDPPPAGLVVERDGPVKRVIEPGQRGFVGYRDLAGLTGAEVDALIARQRDFFAARGEAVEWKLHGHDEPADLPARLRAAGFEAEEQETVVIGLAAPLAAAASVPPGVRLEHVTARADLERIAAMEAAVWDEDRSHLAIGLAGEIAADPAAITVVVALADDTVVSAGWVRYVRGTAFATLWGGSTLPEYRGRGIYTALVRHRAALAVDRGFSYLQVDASDESRPILQRLGFVAVTTTTPYVHEIAA
jgi:GNAT superfamily N-acetyltransferase